MKLTALMFCLGFAVARTVVALQIGDPAPPLKSGKWLKGEPVKGFEEGKVYVVEFWASWCGPCRMSIPHLTQLQAEFKDRGVIIIGQNCWDKSEQDATRLVEQLGEKMKYRVALDDTTSDSKGVMAKTWMEAAGLGGIPAAFVVDKRGRVAWIGHPMELDRVLPGVIEGTFDPAKHTEQENLKKSKWSEYANAVRSGDSDKALTVLKDLEVVAPEERGRVEISRLNILLRIKKDYKGGCELAAKTAEGICSKDAVQLMQIAAMVASGMETDKDCAKVADQILQRASTLQVGNDEKLIISKLQAKVWAAEGQYEKAVQAQTKVVEGIAGPRRRFEERTLQEYKSAAGKAKS